jgi:hypothetical protein
MIPVDQMRGLSYDEEVALVREKLGHDLIASGKGDVPGLVFKLRTRAQQDEGARVAAMFTSARVLVIHSRLMRDLRDWAAASDVGFVDVIHELDERRDLMVNWVHLNGEANRIVARAFARAIRSDLEKTARAGRERPRAPAAASPAGAGSRG